MSDRSGRFLALCDASLLAFTSMSKGEIIENVGIAA